MITAEVAQQRLIDYLEAEAAVLAGQSYSISGRSLTRANLKEIRDGITYWHVLSERLKSGGIPIKGGTPI